jgi:archaellum component FlaC
LDQRESLIERRIKEQVDHLGKEERVIFEGKDWARETEDIQKFDDPFGDIDLKAEEIMSVNEQVRGIEEFKNVTPQQRFYEVVTKKFNPFLTPNFNINQMAGAQGDRILQYKYPKEPVKPNQAPTIARLTFGGFKFFNENLKDLEEHVESLRGKFDMPFDELYHKEKRLVDAVIKATQALQTKEAALANPMGDERTF